MKVVKVGRTTGLTQGKITDVNKTVEVNYGGGTTYRVPGCIVTTPMSQGGDSGALLLDSEQRALGLLFGGSSLRTIYLPIEPILTAFEVEIVPGT